MNIVPREWLRVLRVFFRLLARGLFYSWRRRDWDRVRRKISADEIVLTCDQINLQVRSAFGAAIQPVIGGKDVFSRSLADQKDRQD